MLLVVQARLTSCRDLSHPGREYRLAIVRRRWSCRTSIPVPRQLERDGFLHATATLACKKSERLLPSWMKSGRPPPRPKRPDSENARTEREDEVNRDSDPRVDAQRPELLDLDVRDAVRQLPGRRRYGQRLARAPNETDHRDEPMASRREERPERQCHGRHRVTSDTARVASEGHDRRHRGQRRARNPQRRERDP